MVGPRKATSASPRPNSSATTATSTADAHGTPSSFGVRSSRHPEAVTAASSFATRSASSSSRDGPWAQPIGHLGSGVPQRDLLG